MTEFLPLDWQVNDNYDQDFVINALGPVPTLLNANDMRTAAQQLDEILQLGWNPEPDNLGWEFHEDTSLTFPGLPPLAPVARAQHGLERIYMYPAQWMVILQLSGSFQVGRIF